MKRIISLILASLLLAPPCAALAQGGALMDMIGAPSAGQENAADSSETAPKAQGGALMDMIGMPSAGQKKSTDAPLSQTEASDDRESSAEDLPAEGWMRYTLEDAGISVDLPEDWLVLTHELGTASSMAELYDMPEEYVQEMLDSMSVELYAMTGLFRNHQIYIYIAPGSLVDMRKNTKWLDMDEYIESFRQSMPECELMESGLLRMGESSYARMYFTTVSEGVKFAGLEYNTIVNGVQYTVQYAAPYSGTIDAESIAQMDAAVESIRFLKK